MEPNCHGRHLNYLSLCKNIQFIRERLSLKKVAVDRLRVEYIIDMTGPNELNQRE
jgi:hypothetical protein